jgi:hypothetical protein
MFLNWHQIRTFSLHNIHTVTAQLTPNKLLCKFCAEIIAPENQQTSNEQATNKQQTSNKQATNKQQTSNKQQANNRK